MIMIVMLVIRITITIMKINVLEKYHPNSIMKQKVLEKVIYHGMNQIIKNELRLIEIVLKLLVLDVAEWVRKL